MFMLEACCKLLLLPQKYTMRMDLFKEPFSAILEGPFKKSFDS